MSDTIYRQDAIDAVDKYNFNFPQYMERFATELRDAIKADIMEEIEDLPSAQPEQRWIPCGERLPELGRTVLWCNEHGSVFTSAITWREGELWTIGNRHRGSKVTAWMPLLEPYNEDRK